MATSLGLNRPGQINATGDSQALGLIKLSGELLLSYEEKNVMRGLHEVKDSKGGKAVQFPVFGKTTAQYHTAGDDILTESGYGNTVRKGQRLIAPDKKLLSNVFVDGLDEMLDEHSSRMVYAREMGYALANQEDRQLMQTLILASREADDALFTGSLGGAAIVNATADSSAASFIAACLSAKRSFDENDIPEWDRYVLTTPAIMELLLGSSDGRVLIDTDYNPGGNGSFSGANIPRIAGMPIIETNHLPSTDLSGYSDNELYTGTPNSYAGNFTNGIVAVAFQRSAIGSVRLGDIKLEVDYRTERQGTLLVASMVVGHGTLRPECVREICTSAPA